MFTKTTTGRVLVTFALALAAVPAAQATTVYDKDGKKIDVGARIQLEYVNIDPDCSTGTPCFSDDSGTISSLSQDRLFFRRLRPYVSGTLFENWMGKVELDFGDAEGDDEIQVKDAYFSYSGFKFAKSVLFIGNAKSVFSRDFLTSSAELDLVERSFTGDHNFGVPDRALGLRWDAQGRDGTITWGANLAAQDHDPAFNRMDFDSPVNNADDWNQGMMVAARVDFHPLGRVAFSQADIERGPSRLAFGVGAFYWSNDGDNNTYTDATGAATDPERPDLDEADGVEVSVAYRGHGGSVDVAWQKVSGDTVDPAFTGGLYFNGTTQLDKFSVVAGYMVWEDILEVVAGWDSQDADNYGATYNRASLGANWYLHGHKAKVQVTYRQVDNFIGLDGQKQNVLFGSTQFVF